METSAQHHLLHQFAVLSLTKNAPSSFSLLHSELSCGERLHLKSFSVMGRKALSSLSLTAGEPQISAFSPFLPISLAPSVVFYPHFMLLFVPVCPSLYPSSILLTPAQSFWLLCSSSSSSSSPLSVPPPPASHSCSPFHCKTGKGA